MEAADPEVNTEVGEHHQPPGDVQPPHRVGRQPRRILSGTIALIPGAAATEAVPARASMLSSIPVPISV